MEVRFAKWSYALVCILSSLQTALASSPSLSQAIVMSLKLPASVVGEQCRFPNLVRALLMEVHFGKWSSAPV